MSVDYTPALDAAKRCPLVPVLTVPEAETAGEIALALQAAGLTTLEVTLRTPAALEAITAMKKATPNMLVGAGTILNGDDLKRALDAGSDFIVTPATSPNLLPHLQKAPVPIFPGVATPSEALSLYDAGFEYLKFFPAEANGGIPALKGMGAPMPQIKFMPTGGINGESAPRYLALPSVVAVGGSWMVNSAAIKAHDWDAVKATAQKAISDLNA